MMHVERWPTARAALNRNHLHIPSWGQDNEWSLLVCIELHMRLMHLLHRGGLWG